MCRAAIILISKPASVIAAAKLRLEKNRTWPGCWYSLGVWPISPRSLYGQNAEFGVDNSILPPGLVRRWSSHKKEVVSAQCSMISDTYTKSNELSAKEVRPASTSQTMPSKPLSRYFSIAIGDRSIPVTECPAFVRKDEFSPVPHPTSRIRRDGRSG